MAGFITDNNSYDIKVYINGVRYYYNTHFTTSILGNSLTINFIPTNLGFNVNSQDEIAITGKFIYLFSWINSFVFVKKVNAIQDLS